MPVLLTLIVGAAAGAIAVHFMKLNVSFWVAGAIGVLGAIFGGIILRALAVLLLGASAVGSLFVGGLIGAVVLIWIYRTYFVNR
tara:strand:+ start:18380 stop:18631 length:252 start_codon:yes stop_codon:yes gene_type:complete